MLAYAHLFSSLKKLNTVGYMTAATALFLMQGCAVAVPEAPPPAGYYGGPGYYYAYPPYPAYGYYGPGYYGYGPNVGVGVRIR